MGAFVVMEDEGDEDELCERGYTEIRDFVILGKWDGVLRRCVKWRFGEAFTQDLTNIGLYDDCEEPLMSSKIRLKYTSTTKLTFT